MTRAQGFSRCRKFESIIDGTVDRCDCSDDTNSDESDGDDDTDGTKEDDEDDENDEEDEDEDMEEYEERMVNLLRRRRTGNEIETLTCNYGDDMN